jgi:hypothetical protein
MPWIGVAEHVACRFDNTPNLVLEFLQRSTQRWLKILHEATNDF